MTGFLGFMAGLGVAYLITRYLVRIGYFVKWGKPDPQRCPHGFPEREDCPVCSH
jgi:hypothetical protein